MPNVVFLNVETQQRTVMPQAELAPGCIQVLLKEETDDPGEVVWVKAALVDHEIRHPPFDERRRSQLRDIQIALREVRPLSLEQWEEGTDAQKLSQAIDALKSLEEIGELTLRQHRIVRQAAVLLEGVRQRAAPPGTANPSLRVAARTAQTTCAGGQGSLAQAAQGEEKVQEFEEDARGMAHQD